MNMHKMIYYHFRDEDDKRAAKDLNCVMEIPFKARIEACYSKNGNLKALNVYRMGSHSLYAKLDLLPRLRLNYYERGKIVKTENKLFYIPTNAYPEGSEESYIVTRYKDMFIMREYD